MLKGSTITCAVNRVELIVDLSALSSLPRKVSFLIRMQQAIDHNRTTLPEVFFCTFRILRPISYWNCSSSRMVEESSSHVSQPYSNTGITHVSTADNGLRCPSKRKKRSSSFRDIFLDGSYSCFHHVPRHFPSVVISTLEENREIAVDGNRKS